MSVPRGRGLGDSPMKGMFVEMDRSGAGVLTRIFYRWCGLHILSSLKRVF